MKQLLPFLLLLFSCSEQEPKQISEHTIDKTRIVQTEEPAELSPELKVHKSKYRILPTDQSSEDVSLKKFVSKLSGIIQRKDLDGLIQCLDTGIAVSWGGGEYGIDLFKKNNGLNFEPEKSRIWNTLAQYISMGGAWDDGEKSRYCFPYIQSNLLYTRLNVELDCYSYAICMGQEVIVYEKPGTGSKKIGILSYEVLTALNVSKAFTKIQTVDQAVSGYVLTNQLFRCYNAHPVLEKVNGEWKIISFAPYD